MHFEKQASIPAGGNLPAQIIEAVNRDQIVSITATSTDGPISVYVVLQRDLDSLLDQLLTAKIRVPLLEKKENTKDANISLKVPGGNECAVVVANASNKPTNVTLRIHGQ